MISILISLLVIVSYNVNVFGDDDISDVIDMSDIDTGNDITLSFGDVAEDFYSGNMSKVITQMKQFIYQRLFSEINLNKSIMFKTAVLILFLAVINNFTKSFEKSNISTVGFSIGYICLITYLLTSFEIVIKISKELTDGILAFMGSLIPVYSVTVGLNKTGSGEVYYKTSVLIIGILEYLLIKFIFPLIHIYVVTGIINNISLEDYFSKTCQLLKCSINFLLKIITLTVIGLNIVQKIAGGIKVGGYGSITGNIINSFSPVAGESILGLIYGAGTVIRNTVGLAGLCILVLLSSIPMIKLIVFSLGYRILSAVIQPVSDKRILKCLSFICDGSEMIIRLVFAILIMLTVTIAIVCI